MASKSPRSPFSGIFSRKEQNASSLIDPVSKPEMMAEVDSELELAVQPPRLQRLEAERSAQIEAYRESLNPPVIPEDQEEFDLLDGLGFHADSEFTVERLSDVKPLRRQKIDRRKSRRRARKRIHRNQRLGQRIGNGVKGIGKATIRGAGRGVIWTALFAGRQSKALFNFVYPPVASYIVARRWNFIFAGIIALTVGTGSAAVWWLSKVPPVADCGKVSTWSPDNERLYCFQVAAQTGNPDDLLKGIDFIKHWDNSHPLYGQASQSMTQWSDQLMVAARDRLDKQDLDGAIALAQQIPETSAIYKETREEIDRWQEARNLGQKIYDKIQTALQKQSWEEASGLLAKLSTVIDPSWQKRLTEIRQQLEAEKSAGAVYKQAQQFAKSNPPETLGRAIALTDPINRKTYVWQAALKDVEQWRNQVFDLAIVQLLQKKNTTTANTLITSIPSNINLTAEQGQFVQLVQATDVLNGKDLGTPLLQQMGRLALANQLLAQIPGDSRFAKDANALKPKLDERSDDTVQLESARALANLGSLPFLQAAIDQASQIGPQRPSRIQAQTLVAQWRKEVQRLEDAPLLAQATQLAKQGNVAQYYEAANLMDSIVKGRALYGEAQRQKNVWIAQAQTLEDQPILRQAQSQAESGQLSKAIQTARKIGSNRALYAEAQRSIGDWGDQLQAIADRAIMERAAALAAQGNLTQAINTASSVSSNAVSGEARSSISQWSSERARIRQARDPEPIVPRESREPDRQVAPAREPEPPAREPEMPRREPEPPVPTQEPTPPRASEPPADPAPPVATPSP